MEGACVRADVTLAEDHETELLLAVPAGVPAPDAIDVARLALRNLAVLDVPVQVNCAEACVRSKLDSDNFECRLAGMSITADAIRPYYWGDVVNTAWDEVFTRRRREMRAVASGTGPGSGAEVVMRRGEQSNAD